MKKMIPFLVLLLALQAVHAQHEHTGDSVHDPDGNEVSQPQDEHSEKQPDEKVTPQLSGTDINVRADFDKFPNLHPLIVHFPIVLLLLGGILQLIQLFVLKRNLDWVILFCIGAGFIGAYIAGVYAHPHTQGLTQTAKKVLEQHDFYAEWTIYASAIGAVLKLGSLFLLKKNRVFEIAVLLVLGFAAYSVSEAGHYGAQLVYLEGVGPQGDYLESEDEHAH